MVANIERKPIPTEHKPIKGDDDKVLFISQRRPWDAR